VFRLNPQRLISLRIFLLMLTVSPKPLRRRVIRAMLAEIPRHQPILPPNRQST